MQEGPPAGQGPSFSSDNAAWTYSPSIAHASPHGLRNRRSRRTPTWPLKAQQPQANARSPPSKSHHAAEALHHTSMRECTEKLTYFERLVALIQIADRLFAPLESVGGVRAPVGHVNA
ncbi:hypothetical protein NDU88_006215 [Pleurodeles waltl]|uniref:Uncharacterized protein n=1 Tax=Pleurodeles waltl TaxID=8319 RepID=A0AAV7UKD1_PLEWA|nr:hypothetical protein NDU88_006215 [Pleurodeles waltl]